jgi:YebC/PmpR family DNA-binding regulatory protein
MFLRSGLVKQSRSFTSSVITLAGHSKWANIKHDKAKNDAQKNKISNKLSQAIAVAAKIGGPDPVKNIRLHAAIELANKNNVGKKVIENAIRRGAGLDAGGNKTNVETVVYEGLGPGNVSIVVEALSDNKNRTFSDIRGVFGKYGGDISRPALYLFERSGFIVLEVSQDMAFDDLFETFSEIEGVEDIEEVESEEDGVKLIEIITDPVNTGKVSNVLKNDYKIKEVGISYVPNPDNMVEITDDDVRTKYNRFINALEDVDDFTDYYTNLKE